MPLTLYPATKDPLSWIKRSSVRSRTFNCSHSGGWASDFWYCSIVNGIVSSLVLDVFAIQFPVPLQRGVNVRLGVEQHPVQQITTLLAVLEEHQRRHAQDRHQVLQHHVHRQAEHLAVQEPAADVHHDRHREDGEQVLSFESEEGDPGSQVPVYRRYIERHCCCSYLTPPVPWATKNSARRSRPETMRHRAAVTKWRSQPLVGWTSEKIPNRKAIAATWAAAYTGKITFATQSISVTMDTQ